MLSVTVSGSARVSAGMTGDVTLLVTSYGGQPVNVLHVLSVTVNGSTRVSAGMTGDVTLLVASY